MDGGTSTPGTQDAGESPVVNCAVCGRSLQRVGADGACANCGTPAAVSLAPQHVAPAVAVRATMRGEVVADDRPCLVCGYNLRAIATGGKCPECGTLVEQSLRGDLLKYCAPEYVATLRRGITLVEVAIVLGVLCVLAIFIASAATAFGSGAIKFGSQGFRPGSFGPMGPVLHGVVYERLIQLVKTAISAVSLIGWWMFTTQDPGLAERDPAHQSRRALRVFLAISAVAALGTFLMTFSSTLSSQVSAAGAAVTPGSGQQASSTSSFLPKVSVHLILGGLSNIAFLVGFIASLTYMIHLARRVPDAALQKRADRYRWLLPLIAVVGLPACGMGPLAAFLMYVVLIDDWRRRMGRLDVVVMPEDLRKGVA